MCVSFCEHRQMCKLYETHFLHRFIFSSKWIFEFLLLSVQRMRVVVVVIAAVDFEQIVAWWFFSSISLHFSPAYQPLKCDNLLTYCRRCCVCVLKSRFVVVAVCNSLNRCCCCNGGCFFNIFLRWIFAFMHYLFCVAAGYYCRYVRRNLHTK